MCPLFCQCIKSNPKIKGKSVILYAELFLLFVAEEATTIYDSTETNLVALRRTIYLTIQSSLDFEECAHKLLKLELKPGQEVNN